MRSSQWVQAIKKLIARCYCGWCYKRTGIISSEIDRTQEVPQYKVIIFRGDYADYIIL